MAISIPPGTIAPAVLASGASNGLVKVALKDPVRINGETLIEADSVLIGTGQSTEDRLYINFDRVVFSDGASQEIAAIAADLSDKSPGLKGSKVGNQALRLAGSIGLNFTSGIAEGLQEKEVHNNTVINKPTIKNALLNGASRAALDQSREMMSSLKNEKPVIEISEGTPIFVIFKKEG